MSRTLPVVPGFLTVKAASEQLKLAPRSVRDLIYTGRLPSVRLGRVHFLQSGDVELERRRRLGLPLPSARRRRSSRRAARTHTHLALLPAGAEQHVADGVRRRTSVSSSASLARQQRAAQRHASFERWLRTGHHPAEPGLPFTAYTLDAPSACDVCARPVRAGGRMLQAAAADGRGAARLCLTCARRTLLAWADERRREAAAARRLAGELGALAGTPDAAREPVAA